MGTVNERRARVADAIVATAIEVMTEGGAASLSLGEVARRMGMRTPSLYGYFGSRAELCDEIFRRGWTDYGRITDGVVVTPDTDLAEELRRTIVESVSWANDNRAAAELMFWRPIPYWQPSPQAFAPAVQVLANFARIVRDAKTAGLLGADADPDEMTQLFGVAITGVVSQQLSNEPGVDAALGRASRYAASLAAVFMTYYGAGPLAGRRHPSRGRPAPHPNPRASDHQRVDETPRSKP